MKVDVNTMEDAAGRMHRLGTQLNTICAQLEEIKATLRYCMKDSNMVSDQILASLSRKIREVDQRADGTARMYDVLQRAAEEYRICEQRSAENAQQTESLTAWALEVHQAVIAGYRTIPGEQEHAVYQRYIAPLINFGKRESK